MITARNYLDVYPYDNWNAKVIYLMELIFTGLSQKDFKLPGKYNKYAGNQTARDFFLCYFSSIFLWK